MLKMILAALLIANTAAATIEVAEEAPQEEVAVEEEYPDHDIWEGEVLNPVNGVVQGPSGKETYYNLDMSYVVANMHANGFNGECWIREDGVKMFGDYVMVAADFSIRPLGTILPTSLGEGIVVDTGTFIYSDQMQIDIAVSW